MRVTTRFSVGSSARHLPHLYRKPIVLRHNRAESFYLYAPRIGDFRASLYRTSFFFEVAQSTQNVRETLGRCPAPIVFSRGRTSRSSTRREPNLLMFRPDQGICALTADSFDEVGETHPAVANWIRIVFARHLIYPIT